MDHSNFAARRRTSTAVKKAAEDALQQCNSAANYIRHDKQAEFLTDGSIEN
jgi:hypothetical protein